MIDKNDGWLFNSIMPRVEGGLRISVSAGTGPRTSFPVPIEEVRNVYVNSEQANQEGRHELGLDRARNSLNHLELNMPMNI